AFLELWIDVLTSTAARSGRPVVFGRGNNPINFVSVADVAALVEHAVTDPATRGRILEIGGPGNLTFNQLAAAIQAAAGRTGTPRHVPRLALRFMAGTVGRIKPELGRQARAALLMDAIDLTHDTARTDTCTALPGPLGHCRRYAAAAVLRHRPICLASRYMTRPCGNPRRTTAGSAEPRMSMPVSAYVCASATHSMHA